MDMARRRCRILNSGEPSVTSFSFDETLLSRNILNIKTFDIPSVEWAKFILNNRHASHNHFHHGYDIVISPIADDGACG